MGRHGSSDETPEILVGVHAVREALRAGHRRIHDLWIARERTRPALREILYLAKAQGIPIRKEPVRALARLAGGVPHQGVLARVAPRAYASLEDLLARARSLGEPLGVLAFWGVEDPRNLGAVIRTAEAGGLHGIVIPTRRCAGLTPAVVRAAAGATEHLPIVRVPGLSPALRWFRQQGTWVVALDMSGEVRYDQWDWTLPTVLVVGGEDQGIGAGILGICDAVVSIPLRGRVSSLNLSVAAGVVIFEMLRHRKEFEEKHRKN